MSLRQTHAKGGFVALGVGISATVLSLTAGPPAFAAPIAPAPAYAQASSVARPLDPFGPCGDHFQLTRSGKSVRVVGTGLSAFSSHYMIVYPSDEYGTNYGGFNASPNGGANLTINTGRKGPQNIGIDLTDANTDATLCASTYSV